MRFRYVIALLLLIPLADALFLVVVADHLGWQLTVALVVLTAILGMLLVRAEGRHALRRIQRKLGQGSPPTDELLDGALLIAAGAFLLTPGLVTDTIGFLLALPLTRVPIRAGLKRFVVVPYVDKRTGGFATGNVWVGGFPGGDDGFDGFDDGGFGPGGPGGPGGRGGPDGPGGGGDSGGSAGSGGSPGSGSSGGTGSDGGSSETDDVVDVDYTVEERDAN
ncbi:FxsA family protein [Haloparvum sp. AD34]